jgi:hypothetical protein
MNKPQTYTPAPAEMRNKFISCSVSLPSGSLDAVLYSSGQKANSPVLYNSVQEAQEDRFFDDEVDFVIPAEEYFEIMSDAKSE